MKCDLPGLYVQPRGGVRGLKDGGCAIVFHVKQTRASVASKQTHVKDVQYGFQSIIGIQFKK